MKFKVSFIVFILCFKLLGCAHSDFKSLAISEGLNTRVFPDGVYQHNVVLLISGDRVTQKKFEFKGVVRLTPAAIQLVGLGPFGFTVFKVTEDLVTQEIKTEIYVEQLKKYEAKIPQYYALLRLVLVAKRGENEKNSEKIKWKKTDSNGYPLEAETQGFEKNAVLSFTKYDQRHIPIEMTIVHPDFSVFLGVSSYDI